MYFILLYKVFIWTCCRKIHVKICGLNKCIVFLSCYLHLEIFTFIQSSLPISWMNSLIHINLIWIVVIVKKCVKTENSDGPATFKTRGGIVEEVDSLRATINQHHLDEKNATHNSTSTPRRRKRFLSYPRYVELMVTADAKMARHHGRNLEHYILTIMSVVSKIILLKLCLLGLLAII